MQKITETDVRDDETRDGDVNSPEGLTVISADISGQSLTEGRARFSDMNMLRRVTRINRKRIRCVRLTYHFHKCGRAGNYTYFSGGNKWFQGDEWTQRIGTVLGHNVHGP